MTAHILGGAPIGDSPQTGVIDPWQRALRPRRHPRRRRCGGQRQPRREPVADDHRPGRAGDVVLAEQGRGRSPSGAGQPPITRSTRCVPPHPPCPRPHPRRWHGDRRRSPPADALPTEERILRATIDGLTQLDPAALTIQQICRAAEVTAPTIYYHFGNKDGLLAAAVEQLVTDWLAMIDAAVSREGSLDQTLEQAIGAWEATITAPTRPIAVFAWATLLLAGSSEECRDALIRARDRSLTAGHRGARAVRRPGAGRRTGQPGHRRRARRCPAVRARQGPRRAAHPARWAGPARRRDSHPGHGLSRAHDQPRPQPRPDPPRPSAPVRATCTPPPSRHST